MSELGPAPLGGVSLAVLLRALSATFVELIEDPAPSDRTMAQVTLLDADDLAGERRTEGRADRSGSAPAGDLVLLAGVPEPVVVRWLARLSSQPTERRPRAVMSKAASASRPLQQTARRAGVALIGVHPQTRWDVLLTSIHGVLDSSLGRSESPADAPNDLAADSDLYGLAHQVAALTKGMVSIEDDRSRVLAYSASDEAADELRRLSILGREGPAQYLERLHEWGVFDRLRRSDSVIEVPADEALGIRRRLVVSIRPVGQPSSRSGTLGAVWLQEGQHPLAPDSESVLRGAAAVAARLITRTLNAPSNEALQIQRLLGARGGGVDVVSLAAALSIPMSGPAVVIGFSTVGRPAASAAELAPTLRLHASAFTRESVVTAIGDRTYALIPRAPSPSAVTSWTGGVIDRMTARGSVGLRAAVAAPVAHLADVTHARTEVDRVLDQTSGDRRVTTLADSRTPVLLGEIMTVLADHAELTDPRLQAMLDYDTTYASVMRETLEAYLRFFGDVRRAAAQLHVHPNTLRYRVRRAEQILDIDLADPSGRLLVEIQLAVLRRAEG